jgi:nitroreductase
LKRVLEAARVAPSGQNRQPWKFIIVKNENLKKQMVAACNNLGFLAEAPLIIVACGYNIHYNRGGYMGDMSMLTDASIALIHLILAARSEGLGTCWIGSFNNNEVKKLLGIPDEVNVVGVTPLGYPKAVGFAEPGPRKSLEEITSTNKF